VTLFASASEPADLERRFGGLRRLHGDAAYARLRAARVAVVGLGGVGSWAVEALARSGVAELVLIDMDHVGESNINRQVQATSATLGQSKAQALAERIALIHPGCVVRCVEEFADAQNWPGLLGGEVDAVIDACDQSHAKLALARWALQSGARLVIVGAAGGKHRAQAVEVAPLLEVTHDPLLAGLRQRLRRAVPAPWAKRALRCVFSREAVAPAAPSCEAGEGAGAVAGGAAGGVTVAAALVDAVYASDVNARGHRAQSDNSLNCHGYGSSVTVTATFGMAAAGEAMAQICTRDGL
jgi:tRNA threonylcarbamoyladenosine dehydratase